MDYAIIKLGNKQHRVRDGEKLVVDRLPTEAGKSFEPVVLLGETKVTATVIAHERGPKILIGKYRRRTGYKRHNGFRAATSRVEIALGSNAGRAAAKTEPKVAKASAAAEAPAAKAAAKAPAAKPAAVKDAAPKASAKAASALPDGYADLTVAQVTAGAKTWDAGQLAGALAYEKANAARKGAIAALEAAIGKDA